MSLCSLLSASSSLQGRRNGSPRTKRSESGWRTSRRTASSAFKNSKRKSPSPVQLPPDWGARVACLQQKDGQHSAGRSGTLYRRRFMPRRPMCRRTEPLAATSATGSRPTRDANFDPRTACPTVGRPTCGFAECLGQRRRCSGSRVDVKDGQRCRAVDPGNPGRGAICPVLSAFSCAQCPNRW